MSLFILAAALKALIVYDMEGVSTVTNREQVRAQYPEAYASGREALTGDVNAAVRGLADAGATEIVVVDGHGSGNGNGPDVLLEKLDRRARHELRNTFFHYAFDGIDASYSAIVMVGYHARADTRGFLAHTFTGEAAWILDGVEQSEATFEMRIAALRRVPVVAVSGDDVLQAELAQAAPSIEYALVKRSQGRFAATPEPDALARIERAAREGFRRRAEMKVPAVPAEVELRVRLHDPRLLDEALEWPGARRIDDRTVALPRGPLQPVYRTGYAFIEAMLFAPARTALYRRAVENLGLKERVQREYERLLIEHVESDPVPEPASPPRTRFWGVE